jgi:hypothetical protein
VRGEAEGRASELAAQERDVGRVRREVRVHVVGARARCPAQEDAGLREVRERPQHSAAGAAADRERRAQRGEGPQGARRRHGQRRGQEPERSAAEEHARARALRLVARVDEPGARSHGDAVDLQARRLDAGDLAPDERVARLRVLPREVRDLHRHRRR